jgi:hypothetical protein
MKRSELEHVIRAAATIADHDEIIVVGSQAILGQFPSPPSELCVSNEADVYPKNHPERADLIDGTIGELEIHDLLASKYVAGREKDRRFARDAIRYGLVDQATLLDRLASTAIEAFVLADFSANSK